MEANRAALSCTRAGSVSGRPCFVEENRGKARAQAAAQRELSGPSRPCRCRCVEPCAVECEGRGRHALLGWKLVWLACRFCISPRPTANLRITLAMSTCRQGRRQGQIWGLFGHRSIRRPSPTWLQIGAQCDVCSAAGSPTSAMMSVSTSAIQKRLQMRSLSASAQHTQQGDSQGFQPGRGGAHAWQPACSNVCL